MGRFKSGVILRNRVVLAPQGNESHSDLLQSLGIDDGRMNEAKRFVKVELIPCSGDKAADINEWTYSVKQDNIPDWYKEEPEKYEQEFRDAVRDCMNDRFIVVSGEIWEKIKEDEKGTYYLLDRNVYWTEFGKTNNYAESSVRKWLNNGRFARALLSELGNRLAEISTSLHSPSGVVNYGTVESDFFAIPTIDLYRECVRKISTTEPWWLATPGSIYHGCNSANVMYVGFDGNSGYRRSDSMLGVRPYFILKPESCSRLNSF